MARFHLVLVLLAATCYCVASVNGDHHVRYDGYQVYELTPENKEQLDVLQQMDGKSRDSYIFLDGVQNAGSQINVLVSPQRVSSFLQILKRAGISHRLIDENAQLSLESGADDVADINRLSSEYTWTVYHTLNETYNWMRTVSKRYPEQVSLFTAGRTYEGRDILGLKISNGTGRKAIFVEGGMHAREWISPAIVTYLIQEFLTSPDKDVRLIKESFDWYIVPHANPDGYVYTHTTDRVWRKTRTPYAKGCFGADPNRNWDFHWNEVGASNQPCSDTYAGPSAFSEVETRTLSEFIATLRGQIELYLSFHSYSQLLLFPYGHTRDQAPNHDDLDDVKNIAIAALARRYGTKYTGGPIYTTIYPAAGASIDWAYGKQGARYAYVYELRPNRNKVWTGFILPASEIIPTGEETLDSVVGMVKAIGIKQFL